MFKAIYNVFGFIGREKIFINIYSIMKHSHRIIISIFLFFMLYMFLRYLTVSKTNNSVYTNSKKTSKDTDVIYHEDNLDNGNNEINANNNIDF